MNPQELEFKISRTFNAPRSLVWKAFTDGESLAKWWGPKGFAAESHRFELKPGGMFLYRMVSQNGNEMWGRFLFREIDPEDRLVWVNSFSDKDGSLTRAPFGSTVPLEMLTTVTLEQHEGRTTVTIRSLPINATEEEETTFFGMRSGMNAGFGGTLDQLEAYLALDVSD